MDYALPRLRMKFGERAFSHAGPATWNALPDHIHTVADPVSFRRLLNLAILELLLVFVNCLNLYICNPPGLFYCIYVLSCNRITIKSHDMICYETACTNLSVYSLLGTHYKRKYKLNL